MRVRALGCARRFCSGRHGAAPRCDAQGCERHCALQARRVGGKIAQHTLPRRTSQLLKWARVLQQILSAAVRLRLRAIARRRGGGLPRQRRGAERDPRTTSADRCQRPRSTTDATRPPHLTPSASPTPPRPRLLGGAGIRDRGGACVPFSRLSDGIGHRPRPHKPCLQRAAAPGWRTHPAGGQLVRRRPRAIRAAPPSPPQTRPVSNAYGLVLHQVRCRDL